jgi:exonuclease SbcC
VLEYVRCENFRKHTDTTVHFAPGINAIRAAVERGKSTLLEALAYAYFGAKAGLKKGETIDDVVTYGVPVNKLRVEHAFSLAGVKYRIVRSPKGAELYANGSDKPLVTGQDAVTEQVEKLFGTTKDMAAKLMLARQKDLGGALAGGPTEAGKMIENLADLDLIDELIGLVAEQLPYGDTAGVKGSIEYLKGEAEPGELPDLAPLQEDVIDTTNAYEAAVNNYSAAKDVLDALPVAAARTTLQDEHALKTAIAARSSQIATLQTALDAKLPVAPADAEIAACRQQVEQQKQRGAALKLLAELKAANIVELWDEPLAALHAEIAKTEGEVADADTQVASTKERIADLKAKLQKAASAYEVHKAQLEGKLVREESCAFCGKDLKDIPEVARVNNPLNAQLAKLKVDFDGVQAEVADALDVLHTSLTVLANRKAERAAYLKDLRAVLVAHDRAELLFARAADYIALDRKGVPATWSWTGPTEGGVDLAPKLRELEADRDKSLAAKARREQQQVQLVDLQNLQAADTAKLSGLDVASARATLERETEQKARVLRLQEAMQQAERAHATAKQAFELARARREQLLASAEKARQQLAAAEAQLAEIEANNLLVKKLRAARPAITDKLWALVLGGVSSYLGQIRGEVSNITRVDGRFRICGQPITGLSGSAEDALGLANRLALTRTFLPNIDFLLLDEPAAACNDERETAMLGLLATCGFGQVILVTHSPLADSFADNIITF